MKTIPSKFNHGIYTHFLIARHGNVAMYAKTHDKSCRFYYEVMIVRIAKARTVFGKAQPEREILPSDSEFGRYAWQSSWWLGAWEKFEECVGDVPQTLWPCHPNLETFENQGPLQKRGQGPVDAIPVWNPVPA